LDLPALLVATVAAEMATVDGAGERRISLPLNLAGMTYYYSSTHHQTKAAHLTAAVHSVRKYW